MGVSGLLHKTDSSPLSSQEIAHLFMECGKLVTFSKGVSIYSPGEPADKIYYTNHGEIKVSRSTNEGKEIILEILGPGSVFGEVESMVHTERKSRVAAKKDSILHYILQSTLEERMSKDSRLVRWVIDRISQKQIQTENLLETLLFKSANAKVASVLLDLANHYGVVMNEGLMIDYMITHQEIGNTIATTRETVSYAFMEFRQMGLIDTVKRRTVILNREALEAVATD